MEEMNVRVEEKQSNREKEREKDLKIEKACEKM